MKFWLLTQLRNKVRKLAMLEDDFEEEENNSSSQPQQKYPEETMASKINPLLCFLCSRGQRRGIVYKCARCDVGLSMVPCFTEYHTKVNLQYITSM